MGVQEEVGSTHRSSRYLLSTTAFPSSSAHLCLDNNTIKGSCYLRKHASANAAGIAPWLQAIVLMKHGLKSQRRWLSKITLATTQQGVVRDWAMSLKENL